MSLLIVASSLLMCSSALLLLSASLSSQETLSDSVQVKPNLSPLNREMLHNKLLLKSRKLWKGQASKVLLTAFDLWLRQSGCLTRDQKVLHLTLWLFMHLIALVLSILHVIYFLGEETNPLFVITLYQLSAFAAYVVFLRNIIQQRAEAIDQQVETLIQITKMFWETGMTLESVLKHSIDALRSTSPEIAQELSSGLLRVEAGYNRSKVLEDLAAMQKSRIFASYLSVLAQTSETGASVKNALTELSQNNLDYKRIALQEKVSKLSGKMSLVMMLCFFPALLILLAGPAVLSITVLLQR